MARESTIGVLQVTDLLTALGALGINSTALCRAVGLQPSARRDEAGRLPARVAADLLVEAERRTHDPLVGLHAGMRAEPRGALAYLMMSSSTLDEGLRHIVRFASLTIDTLGMELEIRGDTASIVYDLRDESLAAHHHVIDYMLMASLRSVTRAAGRALQLREVHVRHADPGQGDEVARAFGCPVRFGRPSNRVVLPAAELQAAPRLANPLVAEQLEKFAAALQSQGTPPSTMSERVADVARTLLANGVRCDRAKVARQLGMSGRTLQRGLEAERTSFRTVRDGVLWAVVEALMSNPALAIKAVGLSAGFAELAAFSRAFKRWSGCSPTEYRERLARNQPRTAGGPPAPGA